MNLLTRIKNLRLKAYIRAYQLLPIKRNKIIFWANSFKQYGCSPKYITEYLLQKYPNQFDIVWVFENGVTLPDGLPKEVKVVRYFSLEYLKEIHTAHFIVCNMRTGDAYMWNKRNGQRYIQTWHSSLRLKKIEKDAENALPQSYIESAIKDSSKIDLIVSGCEFSTDIFSKSFWYSGKILKSGTPRCDIFFSNGLEVREKVCKALNVPISSHIFLYAPTFRNDKTASIHSLDFKKIKSALEKHFGGEWVIIYRFHPNILKAYNFEPEGIDATKYSDMQELIIASDILLTDYSSCMFDMAIASKPCLLYCSDIEDYVNNERGLYFNPNDLPFPLAKSNDELIDKICDFDDVTYESSVNAFLKQVGSYENGHASEEVSNYILSEL